jgi:hypothetical protein
VEPAWFVQTAGRVWGPYSPVRVARFVAEGRVTPETRVGAELEGPFEPAARWRSLAPLFQAPKSYHHQPAPIASAAPISRPAPPANPKPTTNATPAPRPDPAAPSTSAAPARPLLVWADLESLSADQFEALLARCGPVVAIRPGLWLLPTPYTAAALRNALSRRLTGADALMIVHAPLDQAAWFNLDSAAERSLRQVWGGGG